MSRTFKQLNKILTAYDYLLFQIDCGIARFCVLSARVSCVKYKMLTANLLLLVCLFLLGTSTTTTTAPTTTSTTPTTSISASAYCVVMNYVVMLLLTTRCLQLVGGECYDVYCIARYCYIKSSVCLSIRL